VDEVAEAAGTTGPALYRLFASKREILDEICLVAMEKRLAGVRAAIEGGHHEPLETLRRLVKRRIDFALGPWGYQVPIALAESKHLSPRAGKKIAAASERGTAEWFRCLAQIRPDVPTEELLTVIYAVLMEITYVALHIDDLQLDGDVRPYLEEIAMAALVPDR
jgi:AcrR family transcriptional regulator